MNNGLFQHILKLKWREREGDYLLRDDTPEWFTSAPAAAKLLTFWKNWSLLVTQTMCLFAECTYVFHTILKITKKLTHLQKKQFRYTICLQCISSKSSKCFGLIYSPSSGGAINILKNWSLLVKQTLCLLSECTYVFHMFLKITKKNSFK